MGPDENLEKKDGSNNETRTTTLIEILLEI